MHIRPFVAAGILRKTPNVKWTKGRGKAPERDNKDFPDSGTAPATVSMTFT
ncbi:MAG: hypothetical protein ACYC4N_26490 [Pirellulaceae bacterium]